MRRRLFVTLTALGAFSAATSVASDARIGGELRQWHKVTLDFTGPEVSETASPNPFTDYRLDVTFRAGDRSWVVPGYYAADGDAANTGASAGAVWRVHFAPDRTGRWTWSARFRRGPGVAVDAAPGRSAGFFDGATGSFRIDASDKEPPDLRALGRLEYVGKHHLRFAGSGEYFLKCGADAPENFLAYADFDGDFASDGHKDQLVKTWAPHVRDWRPGDPTWRGGKGKGIIGAVNYLASQGMNAFSFLTLNIGGDDRNVFPYLTYDERARLDCSRLDQWGIVFDHGTRMGMFLHFKTLETENELLLDRGDLGPQRRLYYRELIARFGHNLALNWNLGEEINNASHEQKVAWADYFWTRDPYRHPIVIHNGASHHDLLGKASELTGFSLQTNRSDFGNVHRATKDYIARSAAAGKPWVVACDEPGDASHALITDDEDPDRDDARRNALWGHLLAGGAGLEWYFGYQHPHSDLTCQDYRTRERMWTQCRHALEFFRDHEIPFQEMTNDDGKVSARGAYCLFRPGLVYIVFLHHGESATLDLTDAEGVFEVRWFDPRRGGPLLGGSTPAVTGGGKRGLGRPPRDAGNDWVVLVRPADPDRDYPPSVQAGVDRTAMLARGAEAVVVDLRGEVADDRTPASEIVCRWTKVRGAGSVRFEAADSAATRAVLTGAGTYELKLTGNDGKLAGSDTVTVVVEPFSARVTRRFHPVADAYLEGGRALDNRHLKVEGTRRVAYLKFRVDGLPRRIREAKLRLTEAGDSGSGTLRALRGSHSDWTPSSLDRSRAPAPGEEVGVHRGGVGGGDTIEIPVTPLVTGNGTYTVILTLEKGGNDIWFGSSESARKPELVVVAEDPEEE